MFDKYQGYRLGNDNVGFIVHKTKYVLTPIQNIIFLGNHIDSSNMIVYLTEIRQHTILSECVKLRIKEIASIREVAHVIGLLVSAFSAVEFGPLFYRQLEMAKTSALRRNNGNFNAQMIVSDCVFISITFHDTNLYICLWH